MLPILLPTALPTTSLSIPTVVIERDQIRALAPDWTRLTFANLPTLSQSGSLWKRSWAKGQKLEDVLTLGDFQDSFKLQDLNLYAIALATQKSPDTIPLNQFRLLQRQSLATLANAIPELEQHPVNEIKPLADLLKAAKPDYRLMEETLPNLLQQDPSLGALSLQNFDSKYTLEDIPGLLESPLQAFEHWQESKISEIPGLAQMPWSGFPEPPSDGGIGAVVQMFSQSSNVEAETISGSDVVGYQMACQNCPGISFSSPTSLKGKRWISGAKQWVQGGTEMTLTEHIYEPTGRSVFGKAFKVVIAETTPKAAQTTLYFRFCQFEPDRNQVSCSPYAVGPVPFLVYRTGEAMLVGNVDVPSELSPTSQALSADLSKASNSILNLLTQAIDAIQFALRV